MKNIIKIERKDWFPEHETGWGRTVLDKEDHFRCEGRKKALIFFLLKGKVRLSVQRGNWYCVEKENAILIPAENIHEIRAEEDTDFVYFYFSAENLLSAETPVNELRDFENKAEKHCNILNINRPLRLFLNLQVNYLQNEKLSRSFFSHKTKEFFSLVFAEYCLEETATFLHPVIGESLGFKDVIVKNYLKVKNVEELASLTNYSLSGFTKKFYKSFNESPYRWILKKKVESIEADLQTGMMSLQEIAYKYDFFPYSNFTIFCKRHLGKVPSEIYCKR